MFEATESVLIPESVPSNISYKSFKTYNLQMQNSYCDPGVENFFFFLGTLVEV